MARGLLDNAARELTHLTAAAYGQLFRPGDPVFVAYIGGGFRCAYLLERFRTLVEATEGCRVDAPLYGPAAGALIEALAAAGLRPELSNVPAEKK